MINLALLLLTSFSSSRHDERVKSHP